jgi:hypothetical protein
VKRTCELRFCAAQPVIPGEKQAATAVGYRSAQSILSGNASGRLRYIDGCTDSQVTIVEAFAAIPAATAWRA